MGTAEIVFRHDVTATVKPEEFGELAIGKRRYKRAPECAYLLSPLRARPRNRNVGIESIEFLEAADISAGPGFIGSVNHKTLVLTHRNSPLTGIKRQQSTLAG